MAAPELRLNVTLDLAAFRGQLDKLAQEAGARYFGVKLSIDGTDFRKQLKNLEKIKPVITINDSQLIAARERIGTLNKSLATLRRATSTPIEIKIKYVEVGKPPSGGTAQIGKAVSGGVRGSQAIEGFSRSQLQSTRKAMVGAGMSVGEMGNLAKASTDEYKKSIIQGFTNSGQEAINGLAAGLKDSSSKIAQAASKVGEQGVRGIKDALGIASPSKVFQQIGEYSVDGLELGFLNGLKDFKNKSISEVKTIVALLKLEFAKIKNISGAGIGAPVGRLSQDVFANNRKFMAPYVPLPGGGLGGGDGAPPRGGGAGGGGGGVPLGGGDAAQTPLSLAYYKNAFKYSEALKVADASARNFSASQIPLIGGIKNLAAEFGQATKQVLIYGAAYKGLGFLISLPAQILNATKSQQQFTNGLKVATQDTGTFGKELLYVDNVQRAFGLNLETTRTGFTRLYASMAPTGFDSGSIEKLFTGISAATASLQLTPDKAERVIYAFGQMASKGQIMSEELKGQLGDVLPGALAIFSKAAGMSVKEFSKAMEDGEFVGNRFREVFAKVSDELMNRFGTGAQAAGKSLQGLINTVGGDFQRVLESFSPLANSAAQSILGPLGGSLKQLALSAQIATGEIERVFVQLKQSQQDLMDLRTSAGTDGIITAEETSQIKAAEQNVAALTARYKSLQQAASDPAISQQAADITKFTEELAKAGTFVMNVAKTIGGILAPALNFLGTNLTSVIGLITSFYIGFQTARLAAMALMGVLLLYRTLSAILGFGPAALSANALATAFNGIGVAATGAQVKVIGLRVALTALVAATVVGAVVAGIVAIAGAFATMRDRANEASQSSRDAAKAAIDAAQTGGTAQAAMSVQTILGEGRKAAAARKALQAIQARSTPSQRSGVEAMNISIEEAVALKGSPLTEGMVKPARGGQQSVQVPTKGDLEAVIQQFGSVAGQQNLNLREAKSALRTAQKVAKDIGLDKPTPGITPADEDKDKDKKKTNLESFYNLQDQLAKASTQADIDRAQMIFDHQTKLINLSFDLREARANSFQKDAIRFQRELAQIETDRSNAMLKARADVLIAGGRVAGGAAGTGGATGSTGLLQGSTGISSGPHFDVRRQDGSYISERQARALFDQSVNSQLTMTSLYGPRTAPTPGASSFHRGVDLAGKANTPLNLAAGYSMTGAGEKGGLGYAASIRGPAGEMYDVGHLQRPSAGAGAARKVPGSEGRVIKAEQEQEIALRNQKLTGMQQEELYYGRIAVAIANYAASIFSPEEQQLQNNLLEKRNNLIKLGVSKEDIDLESEKFEKQARFNNGIEEANKKIEQNNNLVTKGSMSTGEATRLNAIHNNTIEELRKNLAQLNPLLEEKNKLTKDGAFATAMGSLKNRLAIAKAPTEDAARREALKQEGYNEQQIPEIMATEKALAQLEELKQKANDIASNMSESLTGAFKNIVTGSMTMQEGLATSFRSIGDFFADMVMKMIADYLKLLMIEGLKNIFSMFGPKLPGAAAPTPPMLGPAFAKGGIAFGGFTAFAEGGVVTGPTLGLVGEGRYNEAVIPLPDGKSVPVQLAGGTEGATAPINTNIVVNVKNGQSDSQVTGNQGNQLGREIEGAVRQVILKEIRPGGIIYGSR